MSEIGEQLEVLKSIYPELSFCDGKLVLEIPCKPEREAHFKLISPNSKVLKEFKSAYFEPVSFESELPINKENFVLRSSWVNLDPLQKITHDVQEIISQYLDEDSQDLILFEALNYIMVEAVSKYEVEIYRNFEILVNNENEFDAYEKMCVKARLTEFEKKRYCCSICLDYHDGGTEGILLECDHAFCQRCFKEYALQMINSDDVTRLQCPNCPIKCLKNLGSKTPSELKELLFTRNISLGTLLKILDDETVEKYDKLLTSLSFNKYQQYYPLDCGTCPRCEKWLFRENIDDFMMKCTYCLFCYCFECRHSWHGTTNPCGRIVNEIPLEVIEKMLDPNLSNKERVKYEMRHGRRFLKLAIDAYLSDQLFKETVAESDDLVNCPSCKAVINKSDGCNKVTCIVCMTPFCYLCGEDLDRRDPYFHYQDLECDCYGKLFEGMPGTEAAAPLIQQQHPFC